MARALALCALVGDPSALLKPGMINRRTCEGGCGREVWVSTTTLAVPDVQCVCNQCGNRMLKEQVAADPTHPIALKIAPGALKDPTPADRRRRNELEARGFTDLEDGEL